MAKIIYGVAGQGFGHSSRSHLIGRHLLDRGHDVLFAASMKSLQYLRQYFPDRVHEILGLSLIYDRGSLAPIRTFLANAKKAPQGLRCNRRLFREVVEPFAPDMVISDYEPFIVRWARKHNVPCMTMDHQCTLTQCKLDPISGTAISGRMARAVTNAYYPGVRHHVIVNFFRTELKTSDSVLVPPVLRSEVLARQATDGNHIVAYTTDRTLRQKMLDVFQSFPKESFLVYGYDEDCVQGNCTFKKTSTENFLDDLAACRCAIATAGFSLVGECIHYRKKILALPIRGQYEQTVNAHYVLKLGLGIAADELTRKAVDQLLQIADESVTDSPDVLWPDNQNFFHTLDAKLASVLA